MRSVIPQFIYLILVLIGLNYSVLKHGEPRSPENAFVTLVGSILILGLLYWGGFFDGLIKLF